MGKLFFTKWSPSGGILFKSKFCGHDGGAYRFHHYAPQDLYGHYEESHRGHRKQYNRDCPNRGTDIRDTPCNPEDR